MRGWENVTHADIEHLQNKQFTFTYEQRKSKYGANKCEYEGIKFDSQRECERYKELKLLERVGKIDNLCLQVPIELQPAYEIDGEKRQSIKYIADFVYYDNETKTKVVEDVKGMRTQVYKLKKKMFEYKYGIKIKEV